MEHTTIAVDLAKSVFQIAVSHRPGHLDEERRLPRDRFLAFFAQRPPATIVLEACGSAHYWARQLQPLGHAVRLLPAHDVRPYVRRNKTDRTDAKGLLEANRNEEIHSVPVKTIEHQAIASLHRLRSTWLATRTARLNTIRGLLQNTSSRAPADASPWGGRHHRHGDDRGRQSHPRLSSRPRLRQLAGAHAARILERRPPLSRRDQQTGRHLSSLSADPWRPCRLADGAANRSRHTHTRHAAAAMGGDARRSTGPQQSGHCPREQARADHLGGLAIRARLSARRSRCHAA